jgi:glutathione peroxidase
MNPHFRPSSAFVVAVALTLLIPAAAARAADVANGPSTMPSATPTTQPAASPLDFVMTDIDGNAMNLADLKGKVVLLVNVASKCGMTPQYAGLEKLYRAHKDQGLVVVGIPANNFGGQEPGTAAEIKAFCSTKYDVTFPMLSKISVKGDDKHPLYRHLTEPPTAGAFAGEIGWNFTKFLVGRDGQVVARFDSKTKPDDAKVVGAVTQALSAGQP